MAVGCFASHGILVPICGSFRNSSCKTQMLKSNQAPVRRSSSLKVKSYHQNKVFEDCCRGIICYRDESGEIVCEGYDEGPRIHETSYHHRDAEIMSLIQQNWLKNVDGGEIHSGMLPASYEKIMISYPDIIRDWNKAYKTAEKYAKTVEHYMMCYYCSMIPK